MGSRGVAEPLVAVVLGDPRAGELLAKIKAAPVLGVGVPTLAETALVLARRLGGDPMPLLTDFLRELQIEVIPFEAEHVPVACQSVSALWKTAPPNGAQF